MEHLQKKWIVNIHGLDIRTDEPDPWIIADAQVALPGDYDGLKTLLHICYLHNADRARKNNAD